MPKQMNNQPNKEIKENKKSIIDWIIPLIVGITAMTVSIFIHNPFTQDNFKETSRYLSDCFCIPGVVLLFLWGMSFSSKKGVFDGLTFAGRFVLGGLIPGLALAHGTNYGDYKYEKEKKRKPILMEFLYVGLIFLGIACIWLIVYECL